MAHAMGSYRYECHTELSWSVQASRGLLDDQVQQGDSNGVLLQDISQSRWTNCILAWTSLEKLESVVGWKKLEPILYQRLVSGI